MLVFICCYHYNTIITFNYKIEVTMKIKERELGAIEDTHPIVEQMEKEWPEMTKEFRRLQREQ